MGTYFTSMKISACEVSGAVAAALIHDLRVNNFTISGFPEVILKWDNENFYISLQAQGACVGPETVPYALAKAHVVAFREKKEFDHEFFDKVQKLMAELESTVRLIKAQSFS